MSKKQIILTSIVLAFIPAFGLIYALVLYAKDKGDTFGWQMWGLWGTTLVFALGGMATPVAANLMVPAPDAPAKSSDEDDDTEPPAGDDDAGDVVEEVDADDDFDDDVDFQDAEDVDGFDDDFDDDEDFV